MSAKKQAEPKAEKRSAVEAFRATQHSAFQRRATWIQYSPGGKVVRVNIEDTYEDEDGKTQIVRGRDLDIPVDECDEQILSALKDALKWAAEDAGAEVYEPPEPEE